MPFFLFPCGLIPLSTVFLLLIYATHTAPVKKKKKKKEIKSIQKQKKHTLRSGSMDLFHQMLISMPSLKPTQDPVLVQGHQGHLVRIWSF